MAEQQRIRFWRLGWKIVKTVLLLIFIFLPFIVKGVVFPDSTAGITLGKALGQNIVNWMSYWLEFFRGLVQVLYEQVIKPLFGELFQKKEP